MQQTGLGAALASIKAAPWGASDAAGDGSGRSSLAAVAGAGLALAAAAAAWHFRPRLFADRTLFPSQRAHKLRGGSLGKDKVDGAVDGFYGSFSSLERGAGARMAAPDKVPGTVDTFYSLVTDIYELGWGQSFHFSPALPGRSWAEAEAANEARIAAALGLAPGKRALDVGCGVGGPMRFIAQFSGCDVHGVTINEYQVKRARAHNAAAGLADRCTVTRGNFLELTSFLPRASFDGAWAIEATCHAPDVAAVYRQVFECLKPGASFVVYEWVTTPHYDASNRAHVALIDEIVIGNSLPALRSGAECEAAARAAGFEVVEARDLVVADAPRAAPGAPANGRRPFVVNRWYWRMAKSARRFRAATAGTHALLAVLETLRLAPRGITRVHTLLVDTGAALIEAGEAGLFSPSFMLVLKKPLESGAR